MSKFLYVFGDSDFAAMDFERKFNTQQVYQEMIQENVSEKTYIIEEDYKVYVRLLEFGEVDADFEFFIKDRLCDYDGLKAADIFRVE